MLTFITADVSIDLVVLIGLPEWNPVRKWLNEI